MRSLLIGTTMLEELGVKEYARVIESVLESLGVEVTLPDLSVERKALLLYSIGSRFMASEGLSVIAKQALDVDLVLYVSPCVRYAFKELRFMTPTPEMTVHEFVLPKVRIKKRGKALLACHRKLVRPEIVNVLREYGLEPEEDCVYPFTKISNYNEYVRIRAYVARKYKGYVLTCPLQIPSFKEENVDYVEILKLAYDVLKDRGDDDREDERDYTDKEYMERFPV